MADETLDPPPDAAPSPSPAPATPPPPAAITTPAALLRPRRVAFEHGLLPIPKLIFPEGTLAQTLAQLKEKLAPACGGGRVGAAALAEALQIPREHAALALGTLAAVLPAEDPALGDGAGDADVRDVLLFLYVQSYKRLVPRNAHKDSPAVADVWPSTSAFDGYLSALSPIQVRIKPAAPVHLIAFFKKDQDQDTCRIAL
jgi:TBCC domain-containing protein 1